MTRLVELLLNGVSLGSIYALIALGFVIIFKATEVVNFAQGSLLILGGYITVRAHEHLPFAVALLAGVTATALVALLIERVFIRRVRGGDVNALAILTIGIDIILLAELTRRFGSDVLSIGDPWGSNIVHVAGLSLPQARLAAIVVAAVLLTTFFAAFKFSNWGVAMRAGAEDGEAAALMGIRRGRVTATAWLIAGGLAAVAVVFLTAFPSPGLDASVREVALRAFPAAILGGLDSTAGAVAGGMAIGLAEALTAGYSVTLLGGSLADVIPYLVMLAVLLVRPSGLLGTRDLSRV
ncbi:MAG TPA: branched-chain amino acid ABC transporter permease [Jatrophihabitans sp.]|jgi:branched-chain amino acid transport system permease protein|uniref:branched-chain amino acid ABC transporter permease n=1 Tax=Jatrophihabitans sp. TaxID=1932789 RepID=UPI002F25E2A4